MLRHAPLNLVLQLSNQAKEAEGAKGAEEAEGAEGQKGNFWVLVSCLR